MFICFFSVFVAQISSNRDTKLHTTIHFWTFDQMWLNHIIIHIQKLILVWGQNKKTVTAFDSFWHDDQFNIFVLIFLCKIQKKNKMKRNIRRNKNHKFIPNALFPNDSFQFNFNVYLMFKICLPSEL